MRHVNEIMSDMFFKEEARKAKREIDRQGMYEVRRELGYEPDPEPDDEQEQAA